MNIQEIKKWDMLTPRDWEVEFNELYALEPASVELFTDQSDKQLIWEQFFSQDLLQIRNRKLALLLDVGWFPHGSRNGAYFLKLLCLSMQSPTWDHPLYSYETSQFARLVKVIEQTLNDYSEHAI